MKTKSLSIIIITLVVIGAIIFLLIWPSARSIYGSWRDLEKTKNDLKLVEEKKAVLNELKSNPDLQKAADIALNYIPQEADSGQLIIELNATASSNGFQVDSAAIKSSKEQTPAKPPEETTTSSPKTTQASPTTTSQTTANSATQEVQFTMSMTGSYPNFIDFLRSLESSSRLITIDGFNLNQVDNQDPTKSGFSVQLTGKAYYKSEVSLPNTIENLKVSTQTIDKFLNLKTYSQTITPKNQSGTGRTNPFESY